MKQFLLAVVLMVSMVGAVSATEMYVMQGSRMWVNSSSSAFNFTEQIKVGFVTQALCEQGINNMRTEALQEPAASGSKPAMKNPDPNYGSFRQLLAVQCLQVN